MKIMLRLIGFLLILGAIVWWLVGTRVEMAELAINGQVFEVEVARSAEARVQGLMGRKTLPENSGMLFVFERPIPVAMWMKNTEIPLDMIFTDTTGKILYIAPNMQPFDEKPTPQVPNTSYVLELAGGTAAKHGFKAGDMMQLPPR